MIKYIIRLDDITSWMNWDNFSKMKKIFNKYWIKPIIWVVPNNRDDYLKRFDWVSEDKFWEKIKELYKNWWVIAQHGYEHINITSDSWLLKINNRSEFSWLPYEKQLERIKKGKEILENKVWNWYKVKMFMPPDHSFDKNTLKALKTLWIEYLTDWFWLYPFTKYWIKFLPQQLWSFRNSLYWIKDWYATICLHLDEINSNDEKFFEKVEDFIRRNRENIINWEDIFQLDYTNTFFKKMKNYLFDKYLRILLFGFKILKKVRW